MKRIHQRTSVVVSLVFTCVCYLLLTVVALTAHDYNALWFGAPEVPSEGLIIGFTYAELLIAYSAVTLLLLLLQQVRKHAVFVKTNVTILRYLSYCCFAETLLFLAESLAVRYGDLAILMRDFFTSVLFLLAFACLLLGTVLRVVKNALAEGVSIKEENDYTV